MGNKLKEKGVPIYKPGFVKGFINKENLSTLWNRIWYRPKYMIQRIRKGFCASDTWNIDYWFMAVMPAMLEYFKNTSDGVPSGGAKDIAYLDDDDSFNKERKEWEDTLDRMIFLLHEMDEDKCSMPNPYEEEYNKVRKDFTKKYGMFGEKLRTDEDNEGEKTTGSVRIYFPDDLPENEDISDAYFSYEMKIAKYREKCKDEFFELFSKYFYALWD